MTKIKKLFVLFLVLGVTTAVFSKHEQSYAENYSSSEIAMELSTEKILYANRENEKLPMASTTKIMTAILILEDCDLNKEVTVPNESVGIEGSSIYLKRNEIISIKDLLYGLMMRSGNDAATALAIIHSGSVKGFVSKMNEKAKQIGAKNTNFTNPSGLPNDNHYTTAFDLCKIACYAMKNQNFKNIVSSKNYNGKYRSYTNKNKMLSLCEGANGVKTGYTLKAGRCLVSSVEREGMDVVCVVLNCPTMYERSKSIINECFNKYALKTISKNQIFLCGNKPCSIKEDKTILVEKGYDLNYKVLRQTEYKENDNQPIGELKIYLKNRLLFTGNLYSI